MLNNIRFFNNEITWFEIINASIIPITIFFLGLWFGKLLEKQKEKLKYSRLKKYFIGLMKSLIKKNTNQIRLLRKAALRQNDFNSKDLMAEISSNESHLLLKEINRSELYNGYVLSKKCKIDERTEIFEKLISTIDFLYKQYTILEQNNINIPNIADKYSDIWNISQMELDKLINKYKVEANQLRIEDPLIDKIDEFKLEVNNKKGNDPYLENIEMGFEIFINPLIKTLFNFKKDKRVIPLMDLTQKAKFAYLMLKNERSKNRNNFNELANIIDQKNKILLNLIDNFQ